MRSKANGKGEQFLMPQTPPQVHYEATAIPEGLRVKQTSLLEVECLVLERSGSRKAHPPEFERVEQGLPGKTSMPYPVEDLEKLQSIVITNPIIYYP